MSAVMTERPPINLRDLPVAVIGLGRSGLAAVRLLLELGARVVVADQRSEPELQATLGDLSGRGVEVRGEGRYDAALLCAELVVVSPGVPMALKPIRQAQAAGARIIGELELASRFLGGKLIAVTGTNGKSTTVSLIGELLRASGYDPFVGGNLGTPLTEAALASLHGRRWDFVVAEVSSFQLETIETFHPWIGTILNITPDHLDRYPSMEAYAAAKRRVLENQTVEDYALLNADDPGLADIATAPSATQVQFSRKRPVPCGVFVKGDAIVFTMHEQAEEVCRLQDVQLRGSHNLENALAAVAVARLAGCTGAAISRGLRGFRGLEHVMEVVRVVRGVTYINDSKGTNVDATIKALDSLSEPVILIAGGREKGGEYPGLAAAVRRHAKRVILIGEARPHLRELLNGLCPISEAESLAAAVQQAAAAAAPGDTVLLSPVCASFDMFTDYKDRGRQFKECVHALA